MSHTQSTSRLTFYDSVHRTALLAQTAVDALGHVNIISCRPPASIGTLFRFDCDCLGRADGLAQLAGDAALFSGGVSAEGVFSTETRRDGALFEGIEDGVAKGIDLACCTVQDQRLGLTVGGRIAP